MVAHVAEDIRVVLVLVVHAADVAARSRDCAPLEGVARLTPGC